MQQPGALDPAADADGDGRPALIEYTLQTSPFSSGQERAPALARHPTDPARLQFTWLQAEAVTGITYFAESSADLQIWTPVASVQTGVAGNDKVMSALLPISGAHPWVRLRVQ